MPQYTCKNCGVICDNNFCPECGQGRFVERFSTRYLIHFFTKIQAIYGRGMIGSIFVLTYMPGKIIRMYLEGKRKALINPMQFVFVIGALTTFLVSRYGIFGGGSLESFDMIFVVPDAKGFAIFSTKFYTLTNFTGIPVFALASWLIFYSTGFNYLENFIMNIYLGSYQFILLLLFIPVILYVPESKTVLIKVFFTVMNLYHVFLYTTFFKVKWYYGIPGSILVLFVAYIPVYLLNYFLYTVTPHWVWDFIDNLVN